MPHYVYLYIRLAYQPQICLSASTKIWELFHKCDYIERQLWDNDSYVILPLSSLDTC